MQGAKGCEQQALQRRSALRTCVQGQQQRSCRLRMRCSQRVSSCRKLLNQTLLQAISCKRTPAVHTGTALNTGLQGSERAAMRLLVVLGPPLD